MKSIIYTSIFLLFILGCSSKAGNFILGIDSEIILQYNNYKTAMNSDAEKMDLIFREFEAEYNKVTADDILTNDEKLKVRAYLNGYIDQYAESRKNLVDFQEFISINSDQLLKAGVDTKLVDLEDERIFMVAYAQSLYNLDTEDENLRQLLNEIGELK